MIIRAIGCFLLFVLHVIPLHADTQWADREDTAAKKWLIKGKSRVIHYGKTDFSSDSQFWCMAEDADGVLYFGNNDGMVIYDGEDWTLVKLPNGSTVRGLYYASDGYVYVGGYNEIGRVDQDRYGRYRYESLTHVLRKEDQSFDDIWQVTENNDFIVFRSFKRIIAIKEKQAVTLPAEGRFEQISVVNDRLYAVDAWGIKRVSLKSMEMENLVEANQFKAEEISGLLPGWQANQLIAYTREGNSYLIDIQEGTAVHHKSYFENGSSDQVFCAIKSTEGQYYIGTINSMVKSYDYHVDDSKMISFDNLQDQTVLDLFQTRDGNIWALLNSGIDCIEISSPISKIFDDAAVYDATMYKEKFYIATNQGVYSAALTKDDQTLIHRDFKLEDDMEAQAWSLHVYEDQLLISHDRGVLVSDGQSLYHVEGTKGIWRVIPVNGKENLYLACAYDGLYVMEYTATGYFVFRNKVEGFEISGRDILPTNAPNTYWVCHGYQGVYKIKIDDGYQRTVSLEKYTDQNGLPSVYNNNVHIWGEDTVFTTVEGVFVYNDKQNKFVSHEFLTKTLTKERLIRKVFKEGDKTWFVQDDQMGYFMNDEKSPTLHMDLFLSLKGSYMKSMEYIMPLEQNQVLVGTNDGMFSFDLGGVSTPIVGATHFTQIIYKDDTDSLVYCPLPNGADDILHLPNSTSTLLISYATSQFSAQKDVQYRYRLEQMDKNWSEWTTGSTKEYSYLKSGKYKFRVQSRTPLGEKAKEAQFVFEILPLWYQTTWARLIFVVLALIAAVLVRGVVRRKLQRTRHEAKKMKAALELEIANIKLEKEMVLVENDKKLLEEDLIYKSKELANYTILLLKKRELLTEMAEELKELRGKIKIASNKEIIRSLTRKINLNLQDEEHLNVFDTNFERVHQDFFKELKNNYPNLSQKEIRLCGFVRMNLTNKEIAAILNISVRGVETARYRLRKNLSLEKEINMVEFLEKLSTSESSELESAEEEYFKD